MKSTRPKTKPNTAADMPRYFCRIASPIGGLILVADGTNLSGVYFDGRDHLPTPHHHWKLQPDHAVLQLAARQLQEYFAATREGFSIPLRLHGTSFQLKVWGVIALIPYGNTITYSELARRAGSPTAVRAAGAATGRNPVSILIPCHRVVGKDGALHGFAGGLERKKHLLELEGVHRRLALETA